MALTLRCSVLAAGMVALGYSADRPDITAQQLPPVFRSGVGLIEVDAVVTDSRGEFVPGLTKGDFEIFDGRRRQEIVAFSVVNVARSVTQEVTTRGWPHPDVQSNDQRPQGRVYVIVLDTYHVAALHTAVTRQLAKGFIDKYIGPDDSVAVITLGNETSSQPFTSDKSLLRAAVDGFIGAKLNSIALNKLRDGLRGGDGRDIELPERVMNVRRLALDLDAIMSSLSALQDRRKTLVLFSEGTDFDTFAPPQRTSVLRPEMNATAHYDASLHVQTVLEYLQHIVQSSMRANVPIYTVDPRGAGGALHELVIEIEGSSPPTIELSAEVRRSQGVLRTFATETGGQSAVDTDNFTGVFDRILQDSSSYYMLGFVPDGNYSAKEFRNLTVRVKRAGLKVQARRGFYPPAPSPSSKDSLSSVLAQPVSVGGVQLRSSAASLGPAASGSVLVLAVLEIEGQALKIIPDGTAYKTDLIIGYLAVAADGKRGAERREPFNLRLDTSTRDAVAQRGLRYVTEFTAPPGRYQLRFAVAGTQAPGSVVSDLEVVDYRSKDIVMGQLVVTSRRAAAMPTAGSWSVAKMLLPSPPTTDRTFGSDDSLMVLAHIQIGSTPRLTNLDCRLTVLNEANVSVYEAAETHAAMSLRPDGLDHIWVVPLQGLAAGRYRLRHVIQPVGGSVEASRSLVFAIR